LATGYYPVGAAVKPFYTFKGQPAAGNSYANYFSLFFNNETGQTKIIRP
jgi:hypothetical protein